jgi:fatty-acid desaturase
MMIDHSPRSRTESFVNTDMGTGGKEHPEDTPIIDRLVPPGTPAKAFVYGSLTVGSLIALRRKNLGPIKTAAQGLMGAAAANTISSIANHRMAPHGSVILKPRATIEVFRALNALWVGLQPDRSLPAHEVHHQQTDTPEDPHSPTNHGRWYVFFGISGLVRKYAEQHPELADEAQSDMRTSHRFYDKKIVTLLGVVGTHMLAGHLTGQTKRSSLISAAMQTGGVYLLNATFTADAHAGGEPRNINFDPLTSAVFPESNHADHHAAPWNARHAKVDPAYGVIRLLETAGLAEIPTPPGQCPTRSEHS